jgi:hypothetical protein
MAISIIVLSPGDEPNVSMSVIAKSICINFPVANRSMNANENKTDIINVDNKRFLWKGARG